MSRDKTSRNQYKTYWCRNLQRRPDVQKTERRLTPVTRRALAALAIAAIAVGGSKIVDDYTLPGSGFSTVATVAAEPTGPPGPTGGMTDGGGSQFQPPQMPSSMPDYQGGNNQPPLDQNSGISIYNSGNPQAPQQVPGQQAGQQPQQAQQPAHGTQIPDYQTNPGYTQGPGKPNPDYQAPQQQAPQQGQQSQQQPQQQQPSQAPTQTQQPEQNDQQQNDSQKKCDQVAQLPGFATAAAQMAAEAAGGGAGSLLNGPGRVRWAQEPNGGSGDCGCSNDPKGAEKKGAVREKNPHYSKCEGRPSNPLPNCMYNPYNQPYCEANEILWLQYQEFLKFAGMIKFWEIPDKINDIKKSGEEFTAKCQMGTMS
ncbi:Uncharacterised protein [Mycobacteroides abscessus subsp. bolletii]|uniref:hypothetical protein n=1 Tax=Mycobacteroides abscessus TaxID=36809 RepID=UPI0009C85EFF|nr:Uncharacterised protein [Mycobacteroides abscessus subsp. bolletii]SKH07586.1 Uncharacterised protein [Mycobacteroides abscessus subsp. bolletii]